MASKEKDTNRALEKYRSREYVEEDFKNSKSHTGEKLKEEKQLKNWIRKTSMYNILSWFDAIEETKRDMLFVERLGIKP